MLYYFHVTLYIKYSLTQVHKNGPQIVVQYSELDVKFITMDHELWSSPMHLTASWLSTLNTIFALWCSLRQVHKNGPQIVVQYSELDVKFITMDHKLWSSPMHLTASSLST